MPRRPRSRPRPRPASPRRHRLRRAAVVAALVLLAAAVVVDRHFGPVHRGDEMARYHGQMFEVVRVVDGYTLELRVPDGDEAVTRVRLWGVTAPEGERGRVRGDAARRRTEQLALGGSVRLELEPHRVRGDFGRVLAFVHLPDGPMLNETLLLEGLAVADARWGHEHVERFELLERQARFDGVGVWDDQAEP